MHAQLVVIGGGNMARAIVLGAIDARLLRPEAVVICEPDPAKHGGFQRCGVRVTSNHAAAVAALDPGVGQALLAIKPQMLDAAAAQIRDHLPTGTTIISILAGTTTARISAALGASMKIVRAMPNTAARVRQSITGISLGASATPDDARLAHGLFAGLGEVIDIDESLMDAFTALAGSGPAYLFYLAEAMMAAAAETGFDPATADTIVRHTLRGSAELLIRERGATPQELRAAVTSKGGTTEAAVGVLEGWTGGSVAHAIVEAVVRGRDRGRKLGQ